MSRAILYDSTRCLKCEGCVLACKVKNGNAEGSEDKLCDKTFTVLENHDGHPVRRMCMHCEDPACASVCPVGALEKTKEGPVVYHAEKCIGCRYCMAACPFKIPKYEWESPVPRVRKCQMCFDRVEKGKEPACTLLCPTKAAKFGDREELLREAKERIRKNPDKYYDHVYGEHEVGGTSVLVIAAVPPGELGLPASLPTDAMPERTWAALSRLPGVVGVGAAFLLGTAWIVGRRNKRMEEAIAAARAAAEDASNRREEVVA